MKKLLVLILFAVSISCFAQQKDINKVINEYMIACYNDSSKVIADSTLNICDYIITPNGYIHKKPTFKGFVIALKKYRAFYVIPYPMVLDSVDIENK